MTDEKTAGKKKADKNSQKQNTVKLPRELALDTLIEILEKGDFSHTLLNKPLKNKKNLTKHD